MRRKRHTIPGGKGSSISRALNSDRDSSSAPHDAGNEPNRFVLIWNLMALKLSCHPHHVSLAVRARTGSRAAHSPTSHTLAENSLPPLCCTGLQLDPGNQDMICVQLFGTWLGAGSCTKQAKGNLSPHCSLSEARGQEGRVFPEGRSSSSGPGSAR